MRTGFLRFISDIGIPLPDLYGFICDECIEICLDIIKEEANEKIEEMVDIFPNLVYINTVTREPYIRSGRFWNYIEDYLPSGFTKSRDTVMVCGSPELNKTCRTLFKSLGWEEGDVGESGDFLLERAFAD